jgi:hypothetical protein
MFEANVSAVGLRTNLAITPKKAFWSFAAVHALLWTLVPTLLFNSLPLDAIEGVAYGRDWQLGYWKHPPLPWLLLDLTHRLAGGQLWAYFLLGQAVVVACFWAVWRLGREIVGETAALVAVVLLDGEIVFNVNASEFNHNILQLPLFALAGLHLYRALANGRLNDWLLTGLWFALAAYTKYEVVVLLLPALAFTAADADARRCWRTPGPYLAAALFAALCLPQLAWMMVVDHASPLKFANGEAKPLGSVLAILRSSAVFAANALAYLIPVALLFLALAGPRAPREPATVTQAPPWAPRFLAFLAFGPLVTALVIGAATSRQLMSGWAMQFWVFFPLWLVAVTRAATPRPALRRLAFAWAAATCVFISLNLADALFLVGHARWLEINFPGDKFASAVEHRWRQQVGDQPLPYVVGEFWLAGNVILFSPEHPRMFEEADRTHSLLIDPADVQRRGAIILFSPSVQLNGPAQAAADAPWLAQFPGAVSEPPIVIRQATPGGHIEWAIGWALLRPMTGLQMTSRPGPIRPAKLVAPAESARLRL